MTNYVESFWRGVGHSRTPIELIFERNFQVFMTCQSLLWHQAHSLLHPSSSREIIDLSSSFVQIAYVHSACCQLRFSTVLSGRVWQGLSIEIDISVRY